MQQETAAQRNDRQAADSPVPADPSPGETGECAACRDERSRALLEAAPDAMVIVDGTGIILLVNAQTEAMFGYPREELLGRSVEMLVPERFRSQHRPLRQGYSANGHPPPRRAGLELHGLRRGGHEFPAEISLSALQTSDGLLISAAVRDVSDRKAVERRINSLAHVVESSQDAILTKTLDGTITFWNAAAARMYGYSAAETVGRHVSMLALPEYRTEIDTLLLRLSRGERIEHYETLRVTRAGILLDVDISLWPVHDASGTVVGACAIVRDITEHQRAKREITHLYQQQRHVALTLQHALMGPRREVPGIDSASRYLPATQGAGVGGDWYDLISLGAGRVGVVIGDVMGRGLEAATVMGQLRAAASTLARTGLPPRELMTALDAVAHDFPGQLVTCCYLVINPLAGTVGACSAGHLPVLLAGPDTTVRQLPVPVSVPLGVGGIPHRQTTIHVAPQTTLAFYTDGLIERRHSDIDQQIEALERELRTAVTQKTSLERAAGQILTALLPRLEEPPDDVTLMLVRMPARPIASAATTIQPEPAAVRAGRRFVGQTVRDWGLSGCTDTACLLASEILTNAARCAKNPIGLGIHHCPGDVTVEVTDDDPRRPQHRVAGADDDSGRGLMLVDALAGNWGIMPTCTGKTVWFTIPVEPAASVGL